MRFFTTTLPLRWHISWVAEKIIGEVEPTLSKRSSIVAQSGAALEDYSSQGGLFTGNHAGSGVIWRHVPRIVCDRTVPPRIAATA